MIQAPDPQAGRDVSDLDVHGEIVPDRRPLANADEFACLLRVAASAMIAPETLVKIVTILLIGALTTACGMSAATNATTDSAALPSKTITESMTVTVTETVTERVAVNPVRIDATCGSSVVHYGKLPAEARRGGIPSIPWIGSPGNVVIGALFYYGTPPFDTRPARR
jgi:hypothetical protein